MLHYRYPVILLLLGYYLHVVTSEIITLTVVGSAFFAGGWYKWDTIKENTICRYTECCNLNYVPYDLDKLKTSLSQRMFGQPLVNELVNILSAHKEAALDKNNSNKKALVISLHGWAGVGKNYAATMIAEALYKNGMQSKYVKVFMGAKDFDCSDVQKRKEYLIQEVNKIVQQCPMSLIILDEIHHMCPSVLDAIKPMLDHHHAVDGVDYRDSIFIFISNIGGEEISSNLLDLYNQGVKRNDVAFQDFESIIRRTAYYTGGFEKSSTIANHLIDHYIPFLPLEQQHVESCARAQFRANGVFAPTEEMMSEAMSVITYGPTESQPIFANNGCKRFTKQVPYVIKKFNKTEEMRSDL